ncbi:MAG: FAD-dependent oxidoreductase [Saprospiraceae bacterium]
MSSYTHDVIVIGAGAGGLGAAGFGASIGLRVALIDKEARNFGGDCLNYGCVPSKSLLHVAKQFAGAREAARFGLETAGHADFKKVMAYVHERIEIIRKHETPEYFDRTVGTESIIGEARLTGEREVTVNGRRLTARIIVLATGSAARKLDVPGADQFKQYDNESLFWELDELPEHLLVVGGGPIACEMSQAFVRLGSRVTMINRGERLMDKDPAAAAAVLERQLRREGVDIRHESEVESFYDARTAILKGGENLTFSHCLTAVGRSVRTQGLDLPAAGVLVEDGKIVTDDYYRTTNPAIYAVGDAYGREMFSHAAEKHNTDLWTNLLSPIDKKHKLDHFSWVTFTEPEVATFGKTPEQLEREGTDYEIVTTPFTDDDRAIAADFRESVLILYLSTGLLSGGKVLGGCMAAPTAGEMVQELLLLQILGESYGTLGSKLYAYPVASRINQKAARERTKEKLFTPLAKRAMRIAFWAQHK